MLQDNLRTVSLDTEGDSLELKPGHSLGVQLGFVKQGLDDDCAGGVSTAVSAYIHSWHGLSAIVYAAGCTVLPVLMLVLHIAAKSPGLH